MTIFFPARPQPARTPSAHRRFALWIGLPLLAALLATAGTPAQSTPPAEAVNRPGAAAQPVAAAPADSAAAPQATVSEEQLRQRLVGKSFFLRDGWLGDALAFDEKGALAGHSPQGSYTLATLIIERLQLTKHRLVLEGARYGMHFLGQLASEQSEGAFDRVRITPAKKKVRITIDRLTVVSPKKKKGDKGKKNAQNEDEQTNEAAPAGAPPAPESPSSPEQPPAKRSTTSPAYAAQVLDQALETLFAPSLDERLMATLPEFWRLYYAAAAAHLEYRPHDPAVLRQNQVDRKARLLTSVEPPSNEFAQAAGVAGMTLYHVVIGPDGRPGEIAVARPIGFGLDENAVEAIRKAHFEPALKDGQPVAVLLDLFIQFRIYSNRTSAPSPNSKDKAAEPVLPGPYTVQQL